MKKLTVLAILASALALSACGTKFESWTLFDNNCSGNAGLHSDDYCASYVKK
ncbi:MAG: hypothetical protein K1X44_08285 [Alphaproteobacteria bacterium]|nr:hypothetical protein [Alphaproteobacteria bacterium]